MPRGLRQLVLVDGLVDPGIDLSLRDWLMRSADCAHVRPRVAAHPRPPRHLRLSNAMRVCALLRRIARKVTGDTGEPPLARKEVYAPVANLQASSIGPVTDLPGGIALIVGGPDPVLAAELERGLTAFNMAATGVTEEIGYSVQARTADDELVGGVTGWIWGYTSGMSMVWVAEHHRHQGWASRLIAAAEEKARGHGCSRMFVSSFTFQAPDLYRRNGYQEIARVVGLLADGVDDVWFVKQLVSANAPDRRLRQREPPLNAVTAVISQSVSTRGTDRRSRTRCPATR